jgi:hypothetical protein
MPLPNVDPEALYDDDELAPLIGYGSRGSVQKARCVGRLPIPYRKLGGRCYTKGQDILDYREAQVRTPAATGERDV